MSGTIASNRNRIGFRGQSIVRAALLSRGFSILDSNVFIRINGVSIGEIDLIAKKNSVIYAVEVKMRNEETDMIPWSNAQKRRFLRAVRIFSERGKYDSVHCIFAFVCAGVCRFYEV